MNLKKQLGVLGTLAALTCGAEVITDTTGYVTLAANDNGGTQSFAAGTHWTGGEAPVAGKKYLVQSGGRSDWFTANNFLLRTADKNNGTLTFAGDSLTFDTGAMNVKGTDTNKFVANWILYACRLSHGNAFANLDTRFYLDGTMEIHGTKDAPSCFAGSANSANRTFGVSAKLSGDETALVRATRSPSDGPDAGGKRFRCYFNGDNSAYHGGFRIDRGNASVASAIYAIQFTKNASLGTRTVGQAEPFLTMGNNTHLLCEQIAITNTHPIVLEGNATIRGESNASLSGRRDGEALWLAKGATVTGNGSSILNFETGAGTICLDDVKFAGISKITVSNNARFYPGYDNPEVPIEVVAAGSMIADESYGLGPVTATGPLILQPGVGTGSLGAFTLAALNLVHPNSYLIYSAKKENGGLTNDFVRITGKLENNTGAPIRIAFDDLPYGLPAGTRYALLAASNLATDFTAADFVLDEAHMGAVTFAQLKGTFEIGERDGEPTLFFVQTSGEVVRLTGQDGNAPTSFDTKGSWEDALAPSGTKDYMVPSGKLLRCRTNGATFAGHSLTVLGGGDMAINGVDVTFNDLRFGDNAYMSVRNDGANNYLRGTVTILAKKGSPANFESESGNSRTLNCFATFQGAGDLRLRHYHGKDADSRKTNRNFFLMKGESPDFTGGIELANSTVVADFASELAMGGPAAAFRADRLLFTSNAMLRVSASYSITDETRGITFSNTGSITGQQEGGRLQVEANQTLTIATPIAGKGSIRKLGAGTLVLQGGANAYEGTMRNQAGTVVVAAPDVLAKATIELYPATDSLWRIETESGLTVKSLASLVQNGNNNGVFHLQAGALDKGKEIKGTKVVDLLRVKGATAADAEALLALIDFDKSNIAKGPEVTLLAEEEEGALVVRVKVQTRALTILIR